MFSVSEPNTLANSSTVYVYDYCQLMLSLMWRFVACQNTQLYSPKDSNFYIHCHENLRTHNIWCKEFYLLVYNTMQYCESADNLTLVRLHGIISQNISLFLVTFPSNWNPAVGSTVLLATFMGDDLNCSSSMNWPHMKLFHHTRTHS